MIINIWILEIDLTFKIIKRQNCMEEKLCETRYWFKLQIAIFLPNFIPYSNPN